MNLNEQLDSYSQWKTLMANAINDYQKWLDATALGDSETDMLLIKSLRLLKKDSLTIAFAAEFSRGKTELINALFFSTAGMRLLPSSPGRTTMCPTELFYDAKQAPYLRLLDIETRRTGESIEDSKKDPKKWTHIELDSDSPEQMQEAFLELLRTKTVSAEKAKELGLLIDKEAAEEVMVPYWRHAVISFPHPLLAKGLTILDTPGLNALGSEPELTLSMLPNAQAMIFVLAADTGVTKSDMDMWEQHINAYRTKHPSSVAVVLNKIDTLNDELMSDAEWEASIHRQTLETARLLELDERVIFPLSAKQALIAKIKNNDQALADSRLESLETFLSTQVLSSQKEILQRSLTDDLVENMERVGHALESRLTHIQQHLADLDSLNNKSSEAATELLVATRQEQTIYNKNLTHLKTSRHLFNLQIADLLGVVDPVKVEGIVDEGCKKILDSWTSIGIRQGMQQVFADLDVLLNETLSTTQTSIQLLNSIYWKFKDEHGLDVEQPKRFNADFYQKQLDELLAEGVEFSKSSAAALTEQGALAKVFMEKVGVRAVGVFKRAALDIERWKITGLSSLIREVHEQKTLMESKLDSLRGVSAGQGILEEKIAGNEERKETIEADLLQLHGLMEAIGLPEPVLEKVN